MIPATTYSDLLVVALDAPDVPPPLVGTVPPANRDRAAAHRLLATEQVARLRASSRDWDHPSNGHPAFNAIFQGGVEPARYFFGHPDGAWGISTPRTPDTGYDATLAAVLAEATPLIASVRAALGNAAFDAQRFELYSEAAPGGAFFLDPLLALPTASIVLGAGTWRIQVTGHTSLANGEAAAFWSRAAANPETVSFGLALNGVVQVTHSIARGAPQGTDPVQTVPVTFLTSDDLVLATSKTFTLVNTGTSSEYARGLVRIWQVA